MVIFAPTSYLHIYLRNLEITYGILNSIVTIGLVLTVFLVIILPFFLIWFIVIYGIKISLKKK